MRVDRGTGGGKRSYSGYVLKGEPRGYPDGLEVGYERKRTQR